MITAIHQVFYISKLSKSVNIKNFYFISRIGLTQVTIYVSQNEQKIVAQIGHMNVIGTAGIMILE